MAASPHWAAAVPSDSDLYVADASMLQGTPSQLPFYPQQQLQQQWQGQQPLPLQPEVYPAGPVAPAAGGQFYHRQQQQQQQFQQYQ